MTEWGVVGREGIYEFNKFKENKQNIYIGNCLYFIIFWISSKIYLQHKLILQ